MKVIHSAITDGLSGTTGNSVLMKTRSSKFSYLRVWNQPARTQQNDDIGETSKNIGMQTATMSPLAIEDLKKYAKKYKEIPYFGDRHKVRAGNWFAVWTLLLWNIAKDKNKIDDIRTGEIHQFMEDNQVTGLDVAIQKGYLPKVDGWEELTNEFY